MYKFLTRQLKRRFHRRRLYSLLVFLSLGGLIAIAACSQAIAPPPASTLPTQFRIGYQTVPNAELLTKNLGLVEAKFPDVNIRWVPYSSGYKVNVAMIEGDIDVGLVGSVPVATGLVQELPYQVYFIHNIIGDNEALAVTKTSNIQSVGDLAGKTIGVPFGSTTHFGLLSALEQTDVDADTVTILDMQPNEILSAWNRGVIDGGFIWQPILGKMVDANGTVLLTSKALAETGVITADVGVVNTEFAAAYPTFLAGYVEVLNEAVQLYRSEPDVAAAAIATNLGLSVARARAVMDELIWLNAKEQSSPQYLGVPGAPGAFAQVLKDSADFMVSQKAIPAAPDLAYFQSALLNTVVDEAAMAESSS